MRSGVDCCFGGGLRYCAGYGVSTGYCRHGGGVRTNLLLALVIRPLTTHPFRDGAGGGGHFVQYYFRGKYVAVDFVFLRVV